MKDWGVLKTEWSQFTDLYVNSKISIAMLGRAGHEYDIDEGNDGNQEMRKSGTKSKLKPRLVMSLTFCLKCLKVQFLSKSAQNEALPKKRKKVLLISF